MSNRKPVPGCSLFSRSCLSYVKISLGRPALPLYSGAVIDEPCESNFHGEELTMIQLEAHEVGSAV